MNAVTAPLRAAARRRRVALALALLAILALALAVAPRAAGGTYKVVQCHEPLGAGRGDATFSSTSRSYRPSADCDGAGLGVAPDPERRTAGGRSAGWSLAAPPGTAIVRAAARVSAAGADWHAPQMFVSVAAGARRMIAGVRGDRHAVSWAGRAGSRLTARLVCRHRAQCGAGRGAHIHLRRVALMLRDSVAPALEPSGSLLAPGSRRGPQELAVAARDRGSGVHTVSIELNDRPLTARALQCRLAGPVALRLRPCPSARTSRFELATTASRFRQGPNRLRICAGDYAPRGNSNGACTTHGVRVDHLCPVSNPPGAELRARFRHGGARLATRSDRGATVMGKLTDAAGGPVAGARVCVATRVRGTTTSAAETIVTAPATDGHGAFRARLPAGPNREVRVAHWPNAQRALERFLSIRSRSIPGLRLRPRRTLTNGERVRFAVRLPGPANARRRVFVQARSDHGWVRVAGGRTADSGSWRGGYRFRSTTGTRRYAFRATVPRQAGYPYATGRSRIARVWVSG